MAVNRIGGQRKTGIGRLGVAVYFVTVGSFVFAAFALLAGVFATADILANIFLGRNVQFGRTVGSAPFRHHLGLAKYTLFGEPFPGYLPKAEHASAS